MNSTSARPRRARRRPGENRERLLAAGVEVFGRFGYHGAQTAAVAARAEVPQPHVYANFTTKQELFLACFERVCEEVEAMSGSAPIRDRACGAFLFQCLAVAAEPKLQPGLNSLLLRLCERVGEQRILGLVALRSEAMLSSVTRE